MVALILGVVGMACGPTQEELRRQREAVEQSRLEKLATLVEQGRVELTGGAPDRALLTLQRAVKEGSGDRLLPYLLGEATRAVEAVPA